MTDHAQTSRIPWQNADLKSTRQRTLFSDARRRFMRNHLAVAGLAVIVVIALIGLLSPLIAPHDPYTLGLGDEYLSPSRAHLLGTDELGRDILSRIMHGARYDLGLALAAVALSTSAGLLIGLATGYLGGWLDTIVMRCVDVMLAFPTFLLGLALVTFAGSSVRNVALVLAISHLPRYIRLIRGTVLGQKEREFVEAARVAGASTGSILIRHLLPNSLAPLIVYASLDLGVVITALAGLSFLGVGIQPPTPDWGVMLTSARQNIYIAPWTAIFPGLAISITVIAFNFIGDGLRDALDPRMQR
jgi:peptide/nickel transport system permease protein